MKRILAIVWLLALAINSHAAGSAIDFVTSSTSVTTTSATLTVTVNQGGTNAIGGGVFVGLLTSSALTNTFYSSESKYCQWLAGGTFVANTGNSYITGSAAALPSTTATNIKLTVTFTGLASGLTYYYNSQGLGGTPLSPVYSFTTASDTIVTNYPTFTTPVASSITPTSMVLSVTVSNPATSVIGFSLNGSVPVSTVNATGSTNFTVTITASNLTANTSYQVWARDFWNGSSYINSPINTFATLPGANPTYPAQFVSTPLDSLTAQSITNTIEQVYVTVNPNGFSNLVWFTYGSPTTTTATASTQIGNGTTNVMVGIIISNLVSSTQYQFSANASNGVNSIQVYPNTQYFATAAGPVTPSSVITSNAINITSNSASLISYATVTAVPASLWFGINTNTDIANGFTTLPLSVGIGSLILTQSISLASTGLYYYSAFVDDLGFAPASGATYSFTATNINVAAAVTLSNSLSVSSGLNYVNYYGSFNPSGISGYGVYLFTGTDPNNLVNLIAWYQAASTNYTYKWLQNQVVNPTLTNYYEIRGIKGLSTIYGGVSNFFITAVTQLTTPANYATVSTSNATFNVSITPQGGQWDVSIRTTNSPGFSCVPRSTATTGSVTNLQVSVTGLVPNNTYGFYAYASDHLTGTNIIVGATNQFTSAALALAPSVTTSYGSASITSAVLAATITPNGTPTAAWWVYGLTASSMGNATTNLNVGSGNSGAYVTMPINGLSPGTVYFYQAISSNSTLTTLGNIMSFTTGQTGGGYACGGDQLQSLDANRPYDSEPGSVLAPVVRQIKCDLIGWAGVQHNLDGTHKNNFLTQAMIANQAVGPNQMDSYLLHLIYAGGGTNGTNVISGLVTNAMTLISHTESPSGSTSHSVGTTNNVTQIFVNGTPYSSVLITADVFFYCPATGKQLSWFYYIVNGTPQAVIFTNANWTTTSQTIPLTYMASGVGSNTVIQLRGGSSNPAGNPVSASALNIRAWGIP